MAMRKLSMLVLLAGLACVAGVATDCEISSDGLRLAEHNLLNAANAPKNAWMKMQPHLACIFRIHQEAEGMTKIFADGFLRTLFGGPKATGMKKDFRYEKVTKALIEHSLDAKDPINSSPMSEYMKGGWAFYKLMCQDGDTQFCATFLPDEKLVKDQTPMLSAASMLTLREAYLGLGGKQKQEVAERIKNIYFRLPDRNGLRRKVIDEIYFELFQSKQMG